MNGFRQLRLGATAALVATAVSAAGSSAHAQLGSPTDPEFSAGSGAVVLTTLGLLGTLGSWFRPASHDKTWEPTFFGPVDRNTRGTFSQSAMTMSDALVGLSIVSPLVVNFSDGFGRPAWERSLILGESIAVNLLASSIVKQLANRRRPYTYSDDPNARDHARRSRRDANASFYSGHTAVAFASAITGSILLSARTDNMTSKAATWGFQGALAAATAHMRVRAGKHFVSDVVVGAVVGGSLGYLIPIVHSKTDYQPSLTELGALALGVVSGALISTLIPLDGPAPESSSKPAPRSWALVPVPVDGGAGLALTGLL